jgi:hypothetical protein
MSQALCEHLFFGQLSAKGTHIHLVIKPVFSKHLLHVRQATGCWVDGNEQEEGLPAYRGFQDGGLEKKKELSHI